MKTEWPRRSSHHWLTPLVPLLLWAGCSERSPSTDELPDSESSFRARAGEQWELARLHARDIPPPDSGTPRDSAGRDLVPGRRPTIRFTAAPPNVGGRSFCNGYGGPYLVRGDSLRIGQIESTAVGCDSPDSLETRFFRALRETRRFELDSATLLLIADNGTTLTFIRTDTSRVQP